jgi:hypothetical protein
MDAVREVHPFKSIGCLIKMPINTEKLVRRIKARIRIKVIFNISNLHSRNFREFENTHYIQITTTKRL